MATRKQKKANPSRDSSASPPANDKPKAASKTPLNITSSSSQPPALKLNQFASSLIGQ
ncbi:hypothetical protein PtB15_8B611 [Puccinia triticina]|nr:hypothetical protein PtB15_8B611 [Puccinia triticina]